MQILDYHSPMNPNEPNTPNRIILFVRAPEKGKVKTRLARDLGEKRALEIYRQMTESTLARATKVSKGLTISFCPPDQLSLVRDWLGEAFNYSPQKGNTIGDRMANALDREFGTGALKAVLTGTDIPEIQPGHFIRAFRLLDLHDMVIGPSLDGGYWLVGFTRDGFTPAVFHGIEWSTHTVFSTTLDLADKADLSWACLPVLRDVDTVQDLKRIRNTGPGPQGSPPGYKD